MLRKTLFLLPVAAGALSGCLGKTAVGVATAPVKMASSTVDYATTSSAEREARLNQLTRDYSDQIKECGNGKMAACDKADRTRQEMEKLRGTS